MVSVHVIFLVAAAIHRLMVDHVTFQIQSYYLFLWHLHTGYNTLKNFLPWELKVDVVFQVCTKSSGSDHMGWIFTVPTILIPTFSFRSPSHVMFLPSSQLSRKFTISWWPSMPSIKVQPCRSSRFSVSKWLNISVLQFIGKLLGHC